MNKILKQFILPGLFLTANNLWANTEAAAADTLNLSNNSLFYILCLLSFLLLVVVFVMAGAIRNLSENTDMWRNRWNAGNMPIILAFMLISTSAMAQSNTAEASPFYASDSMLYLMGGLVATLSLIVLFLSAMLKKMLNALKAKTVEVEAPSIIEVWQAKLTDAKPIEQEGDIMLDHEYDGIRELDNNLPPWWKYGFYLTIVFSFVYIIRYHVTGDGDLQDVEYQKEIALAEVQKAEFVKLTGNKVDENSVTLLADEASISSGKSIYMQNCAACHGGSGEGTVGPNLTDEYWIHGGDVKDVFKLIKYGNPQKGMIAWQAQLGPKQIQEVTSYILSLQGTNPANGKAPEGEKYMPEEIAE
jgi:cytochrome c oxidase cbb3-type subunit III